MAYKMRGVILSLFLALVKDLPQAACSLLDTEPQEQWESPKIRMNKLEWERLQKRRLKGEKDLIKCKSDYCEKEGNNLLFLMGRTRSNCSKKDWNWTFKKKFAGASLVGCWNELVGGERMSQAFGVFRNRRYKHLPRSIGWFPSPRN